MSDWRIGKRVELHPAMDAWMRGDRYGVVVKVTRLGAIHIKLDKSGRTIHVHLAEHEPTYLD